jgi:hypothetical protein
LVKRVFYNFYIDREDLKKLRRRSKVELTVSDQIRDAIKMYLTDGSQEA